MSPFLLASGLELLSLFLIFIFRVLEATNECPMCAEKVDSNRLIDLDDVVEFISQ